MKHETAKSPTLTVTKKEILGHLLTLRFVFITVLSVILIVVCTFLNVKSFEEKRTNYDLAIREHRQEFTTFNVYSQVKPRVEYPPEVLSILNKGVSGQFATTITISRDKVPEVETGSDIDNEYLALFSTLDMSNVIILVFSLLGMLLAFGTISGEKRDGTLKLMLVHDVPRYKVLLGKYIGGIIILSAALLIGFLFGLIIVLNSKVIMLSFEEWQRICMFFFLSLLYTSTFYMLGMVISAKTRQPATSLAFSLFFWIVLVIIWPRTAHYIGQQLSPVPSEETWQEKIKAEDLRKHEASREFEERHGSYSDAGVYKGMTFFGITGIMVSEPDEDVVKYFIKRNEFIEPIIRDTANRIWNIVEEKQNRLNRQRRLMTIISAFSPASLYASASSIISCTDAGSTIRFWDHIREYRRQMLAWFLDNKLTHSSKWFVKEGELDLSGFPEFTNRHESFTGSFIRAVIPLIAMFIINIILFIVLNTAFLNYDIR